MRVLYFARSYTVHDARFVATAAAAGHDVLFLQLERDGTPPLPAGARALSWDPPHADDPLGWSRLVPEFQSIVERERPDLVHAGPVQSCGAIAVAARQGPVLLMSWAWDLLLDVDRGPAWRAAAVDALAGADVFLCDSDVVRTTAIELGVRPDRVVQFPWGIDLDVFRPGADTVRLRERAGWEDAIVVLSTRSWEPIYGIDVLLAGFDEARQREPRLRLVLAGGGSLHHDVRRRITDRGLDDAIYLPGVIPHDALPGWFRAADVYVSSAHSDGTSISLLEALATGLPAVVSDIPGNREWIAPGTNGWLSTDGDAGSFADALGTAATLDATGRARIAAANLEVARSRADWRVGAGRLLAAYERAAVVRGAASR